MTSLSINDHKGIRLKLCIICSFNSSCHLCIVCLCYQWINQRRYKLIDKDFKFIAAQEFIIIPIRHKIILGWCDMQTECPFCEKFTELILFKSYAMIPGINNATKYMKRVFLSYLFWLKQVFYFPTSSPRHSSKSLIMLFIRWYLKKFSSVTVWGFVKTLDHININTLLVSVSLQTTIKLILTKVNLFTRRMHYKSSFNTFLSLLSPFWSFNFNFLCAAICSVSSSEPIIIPSQQVDYNGSNQ